MINQPLLLSNRELVRNMTANWFGDFFEDLQIVGYFNLLYNAAILVRNKIGAAVCIKLDCTYKDTVFVPFAPRRENGSVLVWKKEQMHSPATAAFLEFAKKCSESIS